MMLPAIARICTSGLAVLMGLFIPIAAGAQSVDDGQAQTLLGGGISTGDSGGAGNDDDAFFVAEPAFGLEMNVAPFLRLGLGASYRWVAGVDLGQLRDGDVSGLTGEFSLRLGRF